MPEPEDDGANLGVVFFHNAGYSTAWPGTPIALVTGIEVASSTPSRSPGVVVDCLGAWRRSRALRAAT